MVKCPVCKTELINTDQCYACGFDKIKTEFLNKDEAEQWKREVLLPFINAYVCDTEDFVIEDGVLTEFYGEKTIVVLPNNVKKIDDNVFNECDCIKYVVLPPQLIELGFMSFADSESLIGIQIPCEIVELPEQTFAGCKSLQNILLPDSLETIASHAFSECENLKEIHIPYSVKYIDYYAFFNCISLSKIVIPNTVETIKGNAFEGCANLTIFCEHISKPDEWDDDWCENGDFIMKGKPPHDAPSMIYWGNDWHYENGEPVPNNRKR